MASSNKSERIDRFILESSNGFLRLRNCDEPKMSLMTIDFLKGKGNYRRKHGGGKSQMIAKAIGVKSRPYPFVVDATAGFGRDAFVLASLGCRVHMIERSPIIAALLKDALKRAQQDSEIGQWVKTQLTLDCNDSRKALLSLPFKPDTIYLDPMYPVKRKSALVKKEMRVLKSIVGQDEDADKLLKVALKIAKNRVVVKRPANGKWLAGIKPNMTLKTTKNRFDLYLTKAII